MICVTLYHGGSVTCFCLELSTRLAKIGLSSVMFNVYKSQLSQQTGSRNLTGLKTLPTILRTNMKLVTKYQISAINSCLSKIQDIQYVRGIYCFTSVLPSVPRYFSVAFFSATIDGRSLIFGHKLHIGTPYRGKHFLTRQIPTHICSMCIKAN
jgi:hypothetical protein